jgi:hypothetical protein
MMMIRLTLMGSLLFGSSLAFAGEHHPVVDIGPGAHIKGPLVVRDTAGEVVFSVRSDVALDVGASSSGVQLFSGKKGK